MHERGSDDPVYWALNLQNPLVASASPLTGRVDSLQRLEDAGAAAIVLPSLFEEQIEHEEREIDRLYSYQTESFAESLSTSPEHRRVPHGTGRLPAARPEACQSTLSIPVIGSLNGCSDGGWIRYARQMRMQGPMPWN